MNEKDLIFAARCCGMKDCVACPCKGSAFCREDTMADLADALEKAMARAEAAEAKSTAVMMVNKSLSDALKNAADMAEKAEKCINTIEESLGDDFSLDRLRELVEADRDGRCVVLPKDGMVYYIEEAGGEKWIGNKPIQQVILRCGFGMALLEFSLFDKGKYFSRAEAEAALRREQDGE